MPSVAFAYILLCLTGLTGFHLVYLGRTRQAFLWAITIGFGGAGLMYDMVHLQRYVDECNGGNESILRFSNIKKSGVVPRQYLRVLSSLLTGLMFGYIFQSCEQIGGLFGIPPSYLVLPLQVCGVTIGVWLMLTVGFERCNFLNMMAAASITTILAYAAIADDSHLFLSALATAMYAEKTKYLDHDVVKTLQERSKKENRSRFRLLKHLVAFYALLIPFGMISSYALYHHGVIPENTRDDGTSKPSRSIKFVVDSFFESSDWKMFQAHFSNFYERASREGWYKQYEELLKKSSSHVESESYKILGLSKGATTTEIKKAYRSLSKVYHPDRNVHASTEEQQIAAEKYEKIVEAYEILTNRD